MEANVGNCGLLACTKKSWANKVRETANDIAKCARNSFAIPLPPGRLMHGVGIVGGAEDVTFTRARGSAPARASARPFTRLLSPVKGESDHPRPRSSRECRLAMRRKPMQLRPYKPVRAFWFVAVLVLLSCGLAQAQEFEGAWKLTMRKLPNGTTLMSPAVQGAIIVQAGLLTRVVFFHTPEGKLASFSGVSTYKMSPAEYTETLLFSALDDGSGKAPAYNQTPQTKSTPVTREGGGISFKLPFDPPSVVIKGDKMTATAEGMFVDYWERTR
jgi:hypothetical protein